MPMHHSVESLKLFEGIFRRYLDPPSRECRDWPTQPNSKRLSDQDVGLRSNGCRAFDISYLNIGHRKVATRGMKRRLQLDYPLIYSNRFLIVALAGSFYRSV